MKTEPRKFRRKKSPPLASFYKCDGGERGIRTLDTGLGYTPLAGERLRPLGHLSAFYVLMFENEYFQGSSSCY